MRSTAKRSSASCCSTRRRSPIRSCRRNRGPIRPARSTNYDPAKPKQLLQEAGYKNEPIVFKYGSGNAAVNQYAQVIQSSLNDVGLNIQIETLEVNTIRQQLAQGQFQMYTGIWIGGNQDPIFLRDLFQLDKDPGRTRFLLQSQPLFKSRGRQDRSKTPSMRSTAASAKSSLRQRPGRSSATSCRSCRSGIRRTWSSANKRIGNIKISPQRRLGLS